MSEPNAYTAGCTSDFADDVPTHDRESDADWHEPLATTCPTCSSENYAGYYLGNLMWVPCQYCGMWYQWTLTATSF